MPQPLTPYDKSYRPSFGPIPTDRQAPSRSYTNEDVLNNEQSRNLDVALMDPSTARYIHPDDPYATEPSADELLGKAKGTLKKANDLSRTSGLDAINADRANAAGQLKAESGDDPLAQMLAVAPTVLKSAAKGFGNAINPVNIAETVLHPMDSTQGLRDAADYAMKTPGAYSSAFLQGLADPEVTGNAAGNIAALPVMEGVRTGAVPRAAGNVVQGAGRGVQAAGQAATNVGQAGIDLKSGIASIPGLGGLDFLLNKDPKGLALMAAPYAAKYGGKAVSAVGRGIESTGRGISAIPDALSGLKDSVKSAFTPAYEMVDAPYNPADFAAEVPTGEPVTPEAGSVRSTVETARANKANGMSYKQAGQRAGWPLAQSEAETVRHLPQLNAEWPEPTPLKFGPKELKTQDLGVLKNNPNAISMEGLQKAVEAKSGTKAGLAKGDSWKNYGGNTAKTVERSRLAQERMAHRANPPTPEAAPGTSEGLAGLIAAIRKLAGVQ